MTQILAQPLVTTGQTGNYTVRVHGLGKIIGERSILHDLNFDVTAGEYVGCIGANGAGKSTLLKLLAGLIPPTNGQIELFGIGLKTGAVELRSQVGLIGHQTMLYRDLSARENLLFFARLYGLAEPGQRVEQMLRTIGLVHRAHDAIKTFSRGMAQRVGIARALLHEPKLLLADEPFDGLDAPSVYSLENLFETLRLAGKTIVLVNHDIDQTLRIAKRVIILRRGTIALDRPTNQLGAHEVLSEVV